MYFQNGNGGILYFIYHTDLFFSEAIIPLGIFKSLVPNQEVIYKCQWNTRELIYVFFLIVFCVFIYNYIMLWRSIMTFLYI